ncbi:TadE/TadG family type IV pilus assembly protein [[Empedobacter] haloabium]|uniref:TadE/TadG family type IV pilus assembly protein n=1 Tax=[Empedobacter] haloabium TaxID=592317 RepID=A0ABZ1UMM1_9BURK
MMKRQRGIAAVEFALLLPFLLFLLFGVIDGARALQANIIVVNLSREGANLVSRGNIQLETNSQDIIYALMASAPPLNVNQRGMMIITRVMGVKTSSGTRSVVLDQYRWDDPARGLGYGTSKYAPASRVYQCGGWTGPRCSAINATARPGVNIMSGQLDDGEVIHVVETFYKYDMLLTGFSIGALALPTLGPDLYSMTIF